MYTYPPSDAVAWRGSHGFDVHAPGTFHGLVGYERCRRAHSAIAS